MNKAEGESFEAERTEAEPVMITRDVVVERLRNDEHFENTNLQDLNLAGFNLENRKFCGADIRGIHLYEYDSATGQETKTNIRGADFTDTVIADTGTTDFFRVDAEGAGFGYTESLIDRRKRLEDAGTRPGPKDCGGVFGFDGSEGNFKKTRWSNVDFGGNSGYEAIFNRADFSEAIISGSDLSGMDFSIMEIHEIQIVDPVSLRGMTISKEQVDDLCNGISYTDEEKQRVFLEKKEGLGARRLLTEHFGVIVKETERAK
ncbi:pentapeptide repeat-containing protein [Patescibacteria group bacterium]|nr:pentapeptide repeat-containing protein [Patescibacteria group bacterium]